MEEKVGGAIALVCCSLLARVMSAFFAKAWCKAHLVRSSRGKWEREYEQSRRENAKVAVVGLGLLAWRSRESSLHCERSGFYVYLSYMASKVTHLHCYCHKSSASIPLANVKWRNYQE